MIKVFEHKTRNKISRQKRTQRSEELADVEEIARIVKLANAEELVGTKRFEIIYHKHSY